MGMSVSSNYNGFIRNQQYLTNNKARNVDFGSFLKPAKSDEASLADDTPKKTNIRKQILILLGIAAGIFLGIAAIKTHQEHQKISVKGLAKNLNPFNWKKKASLPNYIMQKARAGFDKICGINLENCTRDEKNKLLND